MARLGRPYLNALGLLQTNSLFTTSTIVWDPPTARVMALAPHMDDETIGCGGALARHAQAGSTIAVVFFTDGRYGAPGLADLSGDVRAHAEQELVTTRKEEARNALAALGVNQHFFLDERDGSLSPTPWAVEKLRTLLLQFKPEYVYLPFFIDNHPDHVAVSSILLSAVSGTDLDFMCVSYESWIPLWPNCLVRIDEVLEQKRRALREYRSQLKHSDFESQILGLNAYRSMPLSRQDTRYVEAFCMLPVAKYRKLFDHVRRSRPSMVINAPIEGLVEPA